MPTNFLSLGLYVQLGSIGVLTLFLWTLSGTGLVVASGLAIAAFAAGTFFACRKILSVQPRLSRQYH